MFTEKYLFLDTHKPVQKIWKSGQVEMIFQRCDFVITSREIMWRGESNFFWRVQKWQSLGRNKTCASARCVFERRSLFTLDWPDTTSRKQFCWFKKSFAFDSGSFVFCAQSEHRPRGDKKICARLRYFVFILITVLSPLITSQAKQFNEIKSQWIGNTGLPDWKMQKLEWKILNFTKQRTNKFRSRQFCYISRGWGLN